MALQSSIEWTDTLVDEYQLDEAVCAFIPTERSPDETAKQTVEFLDLLNELKAEKSPLWYDYLYLGKRFGKNPAVLKREHLRSKGKIKALFDVSSFLKELRGLGMRLGLVTDCHSQVLEWRAEMLGISLSRFDLVLTSDRVKDVRDKRQHLEAAIRGMDLEPAKCAVIGNDLRKDLAPAKALGFRTVWALAAPPGRVSKFGTPGIPADTTVVDTERVTIYGRSADYCLPRADLFLRICKRQRSI